MAENYEENLHTRVNSFKAWAKANHPTITEENDNGEWCFCNEFYNMEACSIDIISNTAASGATEQMIDDLLYVIARDNECEIVMDKLEEHSDWFSLLCRRCLNTDYANAIWQFAKHLPNYKGGDDLKKIIYDFLDSGDEYTRANGTQVIGGNLPGTGGAIRGQVLGAGKI